MSDAGYLKLKRRLAVGGCAVICDATIETAERRKATVGVETNGGFNTYFTPEPLGSSSWIAAFKRSENVVHVGENRRVW